MDTFNFNQNGFNFIRSTRRSILNGFLTFPIVLFLAIFAGYIKLGGISKYSIIVFALLLPVLILQIYKQSLEPRKIINKLITKVEFGENIISCSLEKGSINTSCSNFKKIELKIFATTLQEVFTFEFHGRKYYLVPEFFEDKAELIKKLNLL